jgi:Domain of unknown function (DUF4159)
MANFIRFRLMAIFSSTARFSSRQPVRRALMIAAVLSTLGVPLVWAQFGRFGAASIDTKYTPPDREFHFIRLEYNDLPEFHRGFGFASRTGRASGWWVVDWPEADDHFTDGIRRLTRIDVGAPKHLGLLDGDHVFDFPWIYATQTGWWGLSDAEVARLHEYLMRGGFIMTDDMWGEEAHEIFRDTMARVLPGREIPDLEETDPSMHVLYDIRHQDRTFIPGSRHLWRRGNDVEVVQPEGSNPEWRAMYDDRKHMIVAVNYDTDIGDAWEFADVPYYPEKMTALAYRYGINYIIYSMTH